jgi:hypothetical protein
MPREKDLERKCRALAERCGGELLKFRSPGNKGVPDRILLLPRGHIIFIEFKRPGGLLKPLQRRWQKRLRELGQMAIVIDSFAHFQRYVGSCLNHEA